MRSWILVLVGAACSKDAASPRVPPRSGSSDSEDRAASSSAHAAQDAAVGTPLPAHRAFPDLGTALLAIVPGDARVLGFGELHARTDRAQVTSSLASFTRALPAIGDRVSDLVLETWRPAPACGSAAVEATVRIETTMKRPEATKSELAQLVDAARAAGIQPHAMTVSCADYTAMAPAGRDVDPAAMLSLVTRELTRVATSAVRHREREPGHRPWIAVYGGALHNDRFPAPTVAEWSYAAALDAATGDHFVELDVIAPALAQADPASLRQPWFPLVEAPRDPAQPVRVWQRGERSFVVVLP